MIIKISFGHIFYFGKKKEKGEMATIVGRYTASTDPILIGRMKIHRPSAD